MSMQEPLWPDDDIVGLFERKGTQDGLGNWFLNEQQAIRIAKSLRDEYETDRNNLIDLLDKRSAEINALKAALDEQPNAVSEPTLIVDEPDDFGVIRIWPFGREPHLVSVDVCPHDPFASEQWKGHSIFFRGQLSTIEDTRRYAQALLKACEVAEGMNRQRSQPDAQP